MKQYYNLKLILALVISFGLSHVYGQITTIDYSGDYDTYVVPPGVSTIAITAMGAQGASAQSGRVGGKGASMSGAFDVEPGATLIIVVGGEGLGQSSGSNGGGGGGSFVVLDEGIGGPGAYTITAGPFATHTVTPLVVAGGGSGTRSGAAVDGNPGVIGNQGTSGSGSSSSGGGSPVTAPEAGGIISGGSWGSAGGGFVGNGANDGGTGCGGKSFINGANGGNCGSCAHVATGGFGGGGQGRGCSGGGGGGGWSGGQGGFIAGGGGSYNIGIDQVNTGGIQTGDGQVVIEVLCIGLVPDIPVTGVCLGESLILDVDSETGGVITWSGGAIDEELHTPPPGTTTYYAYSSSPSDCAFEIDISSSPIPTIEAFSSLPSACEGAIITLWGEGGDTYVWSGTGDVTPIDSVGFLAEAGVVTYTVIGSVLGCEGPPDEITLTGAAQPNVIGEADPSEVCFGDSYTVTGTGSGAVSYAWGGGITDGGTITPGAAGTYIHTVIGVSEEGCYDTSSVTVMVHALPIINGGPDRTVCEGNEITLTGSGALSYVWDPAAENGVAFVPPVGTTVYTVEGTDGNDCVGEDMVIINVVDLPEVTDAIIVDEYFGYDGSIDITVGGGSGDYTYQWSHGPTSEDVDGLTDGIYTVVIDDITIDPGKCPVEETFVLTSYSGIDGEDMTELTVYPNPTTGLLTIAFEGQFTYEVTSLTGQVVIKGNSFDQEQISMENLADGTYVIKVTSEKVTRISHVVKN